MKIRIKITMILILFSLSSSMHAADMGRHRPLSYAEHQALTLELINAIKEDNLALVRTLLAQPMLKVNGYDSDHLTPLMWAALLNRAAIAQALLNAPGIKINMRNRDGYTALHHAAYEGNEAVTEVLLRSPEININSHAILRSPEDYRDTNTPLMLACQRGNIAIVRMLLAVPGIKINAHNSEEETALMKACAAGHQLIVHQLLSNPTIAINAQDSLGDTALIKVAQKEYGIPIMQRKEILAALLKEGALVNITNKAGITALDCAQQKPQSEGQKEIVELLKCYKAQEDEADEIMVKPARD